jgi:hypothetical protein
MASERQSTVTSNRNRLITTSQYVSNKYHKRNPLFRIKNGVGYYVVNGREVPMCMVEKRFPTPDNILAKENCDKTRRFMAG